MLMNEITGVSSKGKWKFNTVADDDKNKKHLSDTFKNDKEDIEFVGGLYAIMRVKVNKNIWNQRIKRLILSNLENCTPNEFKSSKNECYVCCSKTYNIQKKKEEKKEQHR